MITEIINWYRGLQRDVQITIALGAVAAAALGGGYVYSKLTKPKLNPQSIEAKLKAEEQKPEYTISKGTPFPVEMYLDKSAAAISNLIVSEVTSAYRNELNKIGAKELSEEHKYQIISSIDDVIGHPEHVGEPTDEELRTAYRQIKNVKETSATREEAQQKIRDLYPLDFPPILEQEKPAASHEKPEGYGPSEKPQRPSTSLANKATWERMYPRR